MAGLTQEQEEKPDSLRAALRRSIFGDDVQPSSSRMLVSKCKKAYAAQQKPQLPVLIEHQHLTTLEKPVNLKSKNSKAKRKSTRKSLTLPDLREERVPGQVWNPSYSLQRTRLFEGPSPLLCKTPKLNDWGGCFIRVSFSSAYPFGTDRLGPSFWKP